MDMIIEVNAVKKDPIMESGKLSYRFTPVYVAISLALAVPYAQADCTNVGDSSRCNLPVISSQVNFNFDDNLQNNINDAHSISEWNSQFTNNSVINKKLNSYAVQMSNSDLGFINDERILSKNLQRLINKAEQNNQSEDTFIINGRQSVAVNTSTKPAINLIANKVVIKTTGSESSGVYYMDFSDADNGVNKNTGVVTSTAGVSPTVAKSEIANVAVSPSKQFDITNVGAFADIYNNQDSQNVANSSKIQISSHSAKAIKAVNENTGAVTIYNSGSLENQSGLSSLVYSNLQNPVTYSSNSVTDISSDIYSRLAENDNITLQNAATIIGEYNTSGHGAYISRLTISTQETANSLDALSNAARINKNTALKTLQTNQAKTNGIVAVQNLSYITTQSNKISATRLFNKFSNLEKPSAIQVGYQIKDTIISGLNKTSSYPDGMINIRADKNSIGKRLELRGNYVVNSSQPYIDATASDDGSKMTGNITIYDANSTKVYVNNTTIYFEGDKAVSAIDVVDVKQNAAGFGSRELSHITGVSQYKLYDSSQVSGNEQSVSLVGFNPDSLKADKSGKKPKLGA